MLKIIKLIIRQNKRLLDKGTSTVEWTPDSDIQLIIGGNGNGKSSLGREISALPATRADYEANGYKEVICQTENDTFRSITDFDAKHVHSFIRESDGANLNEGGTAKVQLQLIKEHLKFTPKHHELLCGDVKFTDMSANERKALFTQMGDFNVDYAIALYDRLKKSLSEAKGAYVHANRKLLEEQNQQLSEEEIDAIKGRLKHYTQKINKALSFRDNFVKEQNHEMVIAEIESKIEKLLDEARRHSISHIGYDSVDEINSQMGSLRSDRDHIREILELKENQLEQNNNTLNKISQGAVKKTEIENQLETLNNIEKQTRESHTSMFEGTEAFNKLAAMSAEEFKVAKSSLENDLSEFDSALKKLQELTSFNFTSEKMKEIRESHNALIKYVNEKEDLLMAHSKYVRQVESHDPTKCPKCEHEWIEGVTQEDLNRRKEAIRKLEENLEKAKVKLKQRDEELESVEDYQEALMRFNRLTGNSHKVLKEFFFPLITLEETLQAPMVFSQKLREYSKELSYLSKIKVIDSKRESLNEQYKFCLDLENLANTNDLSTTTVDALTKEIDNLHEKEIACNLKLKELEELRFKCQSMQHYSESVDILEQELQEAYVQLSKYQVNEMVDETVMELETESTELTKKMTMFNSSKAIIDHLAKTVEDLATDQEIIKVAMEELGPEKGLIAESLKSFMGEFINQLNLVIDSIWTTPLKVLPCSISKKGLDYHFPVMSYDKNRTSKDVKLRSEGEKEIIDFAFTLIASSCMGLEGYPLFLDETGRPFTETHKVKFYDYLKLLADSGKVSTIFLISHYIGTMDILTRADVNNLDPTGLTIKSDQNRNFKINE